MLAPVELNSVLSVTVQSGSGGGVYTSEDDIIQLAAQLQKIRIGSKEIPGCGIGMSVYADDSDVHPVITTYQILGQDNIRDTSNAVCIDYGSRTVNYYFNAACTEVWVDNIGTTTPIFAVNNPKTVQSIIAQAQSLYYQDIDGIIDALIAEAAVTSENSESFRTLVRYGERALIRGFRILLYTEPEPAVAEVLSRACQQIAENVGESPVCTDGYASWFDAFLAETKYLIAISADIRNRSDVTEHPAAIRLQEQLTPNLGRMNTLYATYGCLDASNGLTLYILRDPSDMYITYFALTEPTDTPLTKTELAELPKASAWEMQMILDLYNLRARDLTVVEDSDWDGTALNALALFSLN